MTRRFFIGSAAAFGAFGGARLFAVPSGTACVGRPNLRVGVLSDLHIRVMTGTRLYCGGPEAFRHALEYFRDRGADAVLIAGDLSDLGLGDELMLVAKTWFEVFPNDRAPDGRRVERLFITGNHENGAFVCNGSLNKIRRLYDSDETVRRQLLRFDFAGWWERAFHEPYERFYRRNVKGYDFLCAHWDDGTVPERLALDGCDGRICRETFGVELKAWLDAHGRELDPKRPFFYQQHRALWKTNFGNWAWGHDRGRATEVLSAFPNAVAFAGDTHYSLTDERSIWQGAFTSVGTSSLRYTGLPYNFRGGFAYENSEAGWPNAAERDAVKTTRAYDVSGAMQGQLLSVYGDRMVFERRDFVRDCPLGDDWVVPLDDSRPYAFASRAARTRAPEFVPGSKLTVAQARAKPRGRAAAPSVEKPCLAVTIPPTRPTDLSRCIEYRVTVTGGQGKEAVFYALAEGFNHPVGTPRTCAPTEMTVSLDRLPPDPQTVQVAPLDCWGHVGSALSASFPDSTKGLT